ncbi:ParB domain-containing protein [Acetobacteraceae bacterium EV16G]|uniref:ParB domain-containing protein n=1 Tax=Sorlinia euscelidii TaxID=3081148 RepID=A0ABU7U0H5_9PROT
MNMLITEVEIKSVFIGERLRAVDPDYVALLAASIEENGLRQPIEVRKSDDGGYLLISGGHRLEAVRSLGETKIPAIIVEASELEAQLREIDENLFRRDLSALDRATFLARRKEVYQELHPETRAGGDRRSKQMRKVEHQATDDDDQMDKVDHLIPSFSDVTADRLGLSRRTIDRAIVLHKAILPDVREKIASTWLADSGAQLDMLAKQMPENQRRIADLIVEQGIRATVADIMRQLEEKPPAPKPGKMEVFLGLWRKCSARERRGIAELVSQNFPEVCFRTSWDFADDEQQAAFINIIAPKLPGFRAGDAA